MGNGNTKILQNGDEIALLDPEEGKFIIFHLSGEQLYYVFVDESGKDKKKHQKEVDELKQKLQLTVERDKQVDYFSY
jgi:hypothetical protein